VTARVRALQEQVRALEHARRPRVDVDGAAATLKVATEVEDVHVEAHRIDGASHEDLRAAGDRLRQRSPRGVFVLGGVSDGRVNLVAIVTPDLHTHGLRADAVLRAVASRVGGTGGGKADLAQGGGRDAARLDAALGAVVDDVRQLMAAS